MPANEGAGRVDRNSIFAPIRLRRSLASRRRKGAAPVAARWGVPIGGWLCVTLEPCNCEIEVQIQGLPSRRTGTSLEAPLWTHWPQETEGSSQVPVPAPLPRPRLGTGTSAFPPGFHPFVSPMKTIRSAIGFLAIE